MNEFMTQKEYDAKNSNQVGLSMPPNLGDAILSFEHRKIVLHGYLTEERGGTIRQAMHIMADTSKLIKPVNTLSNLIISKIAPKYQVVQAINQPFEFTVSTYGGSTCEMYMIHDLMTRIKENICEIVTLGSGKVMSAGVMIVASGTKGKRFAEKNCQFMIHDIAGGLHGKYADMEVQMKFMKQSRKTYIDIMSEITGMSKELLNEIQDAGKDHFFDAQKAKEYGIIDGIV